MYCTMYRALFFLPTPLSDTVSRWSRWPHARMRCCPYGPAPRRTGNGGAAAAGLSVCAIEQGVGYFDHA
jgi:hypothetical protein